MYELTSYFAGKRILVTGGAGFVGSFLVERLLQLGSRVVVVDNFSTGRRENLQGVIQVQNLNIIEADVSQPVETYFNGSVDAIYHLASPASPVDFEKIPEAIYQVNAWGTHSLCQYAIQHGARLLFASSSEAYGEPEVHPQTEDYRGNVSTTGPRACYDESKRFGEMVVSVFEKQHHLDGRTVRIFNTYGPRMKVDDGRVIPTFIRQALAHQPLTIHGDGSQTRSFCYVADLVEYLLIVMLHEDARGELYNIGNAGEYTIRHVAERVINLTGSSSTIEHVARPEDDPSRRKPDLAKVIALTGYESQVTIDAGLLKTIEYFKH